jgi:hypothetical protein
MGGNSLGQLGHAGIGEARQNAFGSAGLFMLRGLGVDQVPTLYECAQCGAVVGSVWQFNSQQLCRVCFGRARGFDSSPSGPADRSVRVVRADGTIAEVGAKGKPAPVKTGEPVPLGGAGTRKIKALPKEE